MFPGARHYEGDLAGIATEKGDFGKISFVPRYFPAQET